MQQKPHRPAGGLRRAGLAVLLAALALLCCFPGLFGEGRARPPDLEAPDAGQSVGAVYFFDVGQGDAALLYSKGEYVLIDGGPELAEDTLTASLEALGVERLRAVIATHPHEDHIGGLDRVLTRFPADAIYMPDRDATSVCFERILDAAEAQGLPITIPTPGDTLSFGSGRLEFLSPAPACGYESTNDFSIVTRLVLGQLEVLFMGDAERPVERDLLHSGFDLHCDVIKLGHHGSSSSSSEAFLRAASPRRAVISCAKENDYGHPDSETLETLSRLGIDYQCTYDGTILLRSPEDAA